MKKTLIIFLCATFAFGCALSPEKRAQKLIKAHMKETMHDWSSYEPVKFGLLDSVFTDIKDEPDYAAFSAKIKVYNKQFEEAIEEARSYMASLLFDNADSYIRLAERYSDTISKYEPLLDSLISNYKPTFKGWSMTHTSRGNNALGNKIIGTNIFYFDPDITQIVDIKSMDDDD